MRIRHGLSALLGTLILFSAPPEATAQSTAQLGKSVNPVPIEILHYRPPFRAEPQSYNLREQMEKGAVLFFYWLPSNQGSVNELVKLDKFARSLEGDELTILTVSRARDEGEVSAVRDAIEAENIRLPVLLDKMPLMQELGVNTVPSYVALGADQRIHINDVGQLDHNLRNAERFSDVVKQAAASGEFPTVQGPGRDAIYQLAGNEAPGFSLNDLEGKEHSLSDHVGEKPVVLVFWSALCPHCQREMPRLQQYLENNPDKLNIVSVTAFNNDSHKRATYDFVEEHNLTYPVLVDSGTVNNTYSIQAIPAWLLVDTNGVVRHATVGADHQLEQTLDREIAKVAD